jgi:hypothetical protein
VSLDGLLADHEVPGDLPVAVAAGDQLEHFTFARRERLQRIRLCVPRIASAALNSRVARTAPRP